MSLALSNTPDTPLVKTSPLDPEIVRFGRREVPLDRFCDAVRHILTATEIQGENDPRLALVEDVKAMERITGYNSSAQRLGYTSEPDQDDSLRPYLNLGSVKIEAAFVQFENTRVSLYDFCAATCYVLRNMDLEGENDLRLVLYEDIKSISRTPDGTHLVFEDRTDLSKADLPERTD